MCSCPEQSQDQSLPFVRYVLQGAFQGWDVVRELFFIRDGIKGAHRWCKTENQFKIPCKNSVT